MDCPEALNEIGALIDGELPTAERAALEAHLSGCGDCRDVYQRLRVCDAQLLRAFAPRRQAAAAVAERVIEQVRGPRQRLPRLVSWSSLLVAAAAGFLFAVMVISPRAWRGEPVAAVPVARLSLATGPTEVRSPRQIAWLGCPTNGEIEAGASVRTAPGARCELQVSDGTQIRLDRGTEIQISQPHTVKMTKGELYASVSGAGVPLCVETPDAQIEAARGTFDFACSPGEASLTVIDGSASVACQSGTRRVEPGERVRLVGGRLQDAAPVRDLLQTTAWINELLALKGADNPEFAERLNDILAQVGQSKLSYLYEDEIRRLGTAAALPLIRYVQSPRSQSNQAARISAARIAADLADSTMTGDLINLLADDDPRVRVYSAQALERLTGKNQGRPAAEWADDLPDCQPALDAWIAWWREQGGHRS